MAATLYNLNPGASTLGTTAVPVTGSSVTGSPQTVVASTSGSTNSDYRVRLSALDTTLYKLTGSSGGSSILAPLLATNGMLFPYSPSITFNQGVDYMDIPMVHSDTNYQAYTRTPSVKISVSGKFTVQNQYEGQYALAAVHFLRTASKSHFGANDPQAGLPPPVLLFSGYGNYMFGNYSPTGGLRVILNSHSWSYDENIDTIPIKVSSGIVKLPSLFTIQCELTVIQTPQRMTQTFTFQDFASGKLMQNSDGWI